MSQCDGGTFFTNLILREAKHNLQYIFRNSQLTKFIKKLTVPSKSYAYLIAIAHGWEGDGTLKKEAPIKMAGIAHITGGGVWKKFREILPEGVGAELNKMPKPARVLLEAQELSWDIPDLQLTDLQAYGTLHGGCGTLVVCKTKKDAELLIKVAKALGVRAMIVGETTESANCEVRVKSRFKEGRWLSSEELE